MYKVDEEWNISDIPKNNLRVWDIISVKKSDSKEYAVAIILSKQVIFWGNFCAFLDSKYSYIPCEKEVLEEISLWKYRFLFIDFYKAINEDRVSQIAKSFAVEEIFWGKIKLKEYLEDYDDVSWEISYSTLNQRERLTEKELEDYILQDNGMITPILLDIIYPQEVEETGTLELLAYQEDIVAQNGYFYSIKDIDKLDFSPSTMVKPEAQSAEELNTPKVGLVVEQIDFLL